MKTIFKITLFFLSLLLLGACGKKKPKTKEPIVFETGTVTDTDGKVYKTVKIGEQWWMAEDLKVIKYRDSTAIKKIDDNVQWSNDIAGAYVINNGNYYYNWYALTNAKQLAPEGWHIPSDKEWKILEQHLGMSENVANQLAWRGDFEGNKLKFGGPSIPDVDEVSQGWKNQANIQGFEFVNESGFSALSNNCRLQSGIYGAPIDLNQGFWWSVSTFNAEEAWFRNLDYKQTNIFRSHVSKKYGMCVRCVKDL